jgi:hypothetical protein
MQDVVDFNLSHPHLELPPGYEAQTHLVESAASLHPTEHAGYQATIDGYRSHARETLAAVAKENRLDAFVLPHSISAPWSKAGWPQVVVPMGFLPQSVESVPVLNPQQAPFPVE